MTTTYYLLRILHLVAMALWLGAALWVPGDVRRTLALGPEHLAGLGARIRPALRLEVWAGVATLLTGIALIGVGAPHRMGVVVGFVLALVLLILVMTIVLPAGKRVAALTEAGGDLTEARRLAKSLAAFSGIAHLLWLAALVAMVLPY
jgi:hypothetical protein